MSQTAAAAASRCCALPSERGPRCPRRSLCVPLPFCWRWSSMRCLSFRHRPEPAGRLRRHVGGTFANMTRFSWMLRDLSTLLCVGIALAPAFKMRFWNCGGEGSDFDWRPDRRPIMVYQGNNLPLPLLFAAMALGSIAAGALWASSLRGSSPAGTRTRRCLP